MKRIFVLVAFIATAFSLSAQKEVLLRLNPEKGYSYSQVMTMNTSVSIKGGNKSIDLAMPIDIEFSYRVTNVYPDSVEFDFSFDRVVGTLDFMGKKMSFDTDTLAKTEEDSIFFEMLKQPFSAVKDSRGNILRIKGIEEFYKKLLSELPAEEQSDSINKELSEILTEDRLIEAFQHGNMAFPAEPVHKGYSWSTSSIQQLEGLFSLSYNTTNKIKSIKKRAGKAVIASTSQINIGGIKEIDELKAMLGLTKGIKFDIEYMVDLKTGIIQSANGKMNLPMKIKNTDEKGKKRTIKILVKMDIKLRTK